MISTYLGQQFMRFALAMPLLAILAAAPAQILAQAERKPPEVKKIQVGFQSYQKEDNTAYKPGLWTPVYVEIFGGTDGVEPARGGFIEIQTTDSDDVGTKLIVPAKVLPLDTQTVLGYVKTGRTGQVSSEVQIILNANGREYKPISIDPFNSVQVNTHLYLTIGQRMVDVHEASQRLALKAPVQDKFQVRFDLPRQTVFESDVKRLPKVWYGYNGIDLIFLSTESEKFLAELRNDQEGRLKAIAQWVRRGGRLVVPITHHRQPQVNALLSDKRSWHPPIPVVPPPSPGKVRDLALERLADVEVWGAVQGAPFRRTDPAKPGKFLPIEVALLDPGNVPPGDWEVLAKAPDQRPLIARVRYGLGQITYLAFSFDDEAFRAWEGGKQMFLQNLLNKLGPKAPDAAGFVGGGGGGIPGQRDESGDLATDLLRDLDNFDVAVIPFGYVAFFILLYIIVVGPIDFIILKFVLKRLEWTWITFPAVVLGVSVLAYFAAYALKGRDLKINKVDVVDFDLRTSLDEKRRPQNVHAYGQTFFTILSPRIQNYTVGVEPNPLFWGDEAPKKALSADLVSWLGRPSGGAFEMRRSSSPGFFRRPYEYALDASGLKGVPIPVWTTKAFCASWEQPLARSPFTVDLSYHLRDFKGRDVKILGKLENHLGVDLSDVWIIYQNRCYAIPGGLKSVNRGEAAPEFAVPPQPGQVSHDVRTWVSRNADENENKVEQRAWNPFMPPVVKQILFHESYDTQNTVRNHAFRPLDLSWRHTKEGLDAARDRGTREAILFARVNVASGAGDALQRDQAFPLPTKIWLGGDLPGQDAAYPSLIGNMNQETYIRVILPLKPGDE